MMSEAPAAAMFPSLSALRATHSDLLRRFRDEGENPALLNEIREFLRRGSATGALLDVDEERWASQSLLDYWVTTLYRGDHAAPDATLVDFDPMLAPELDDDLRPYVGLDAFHEDEADRFFGRKRLLDLLVDRLTTERLLAVLGPSGSGKSSLVRGGLLPILRNDALEGSANWRLLPSMVPGSEPLRNLARLLRKAGYTVQANDLGTDPQRLVTLLSNGWPDSVEPQTTPQPAVLVIDQFEEVFTLCDDNEQRQIFINHLLALADLPTPQHRVIITMRSDFEAFVAQVPALQQRFEQGQVRMLPLNATELRAAVERPAEMVGLKFEPGVVDALLQDILGEPAALPLLQFTLLKLWENRDRNRVTWDAYNRLGGGRLALARSADAFYDELIPEEQVTARRILLRMVRPGDGLEVTSNRVRKESFYTAGEAVDRVDRVLAKLIDVHLIKVTEGERPEDTQVEVAHEALVRNWPRLVDWLEEERAALATRRRYELRAAEWVRLGRGSSGLLDDIELREVERWLRSPAATLGYNESLDALVKTSREALEAAEAEKEATRQRELEQARMLADSERKRAETQRAAAVASLRQASRLRIVALVAGVAAIAAIIFAATTIISQAYAAQQQAIATESQEEAATAQIVADVAQDEASRSANEADALSLTVASQSAKTQGQVDMARSLALAAAEKLPGQPLTQLPLSESAYEPGTRRLFPSPVAVTLGFGPEQRALAYDGEELLVWELATGDILQTFAAAGLTDGHFSADGQTIVAGFIDGAVLQWDIDSGRLVNQFQLESSVRSVVSSPDGRFVVAGTSAGTVVGWDLTLGTQQAFTVTENPAFPDVQHLAFSSNGNVFVAATATSARAWETATGTLRWSTASEGDTPTILSLAIDAVGETVLTGGPNGGVRAWDIVGNQPALTLTGHTGPVVALAFSADGRMALSGDTEGVILQWDLVAEIQLYMHFGHSDRIVALAFRDGIQTFVSSSVTPQVRLWDAFNGALVGSYSSAPGEVVTAEIGPKAGRLLLAVTSLTEGGSYTNGLVQLIDLATGQELARLDMGDTQPVATFAPSGETVLVGTLDGQLLAWELTSGTVTTLSADNNRRITAVAFHPDGTEFLSGTSDGSVWLHETATGDQIQTFAPASRRPIVRVAFDEEREQAFAQDDQGVTIWAATSGDEVARWEQSELSLGVFSFSTVAQAVLENLEDGTLRLWDIPSGQELNRYTGFGTNTLALTLAADGSHFMTGNVDGGTRLWELASGLETRRYQSSPLFNTFRLLQVGLAPTETMAFSVFEPGPLTSGLTPQIQIWRIDGNEELIAWTYDNRYLPDLSCEQRLTFNLAAPECEDVVLPTPTPNEPTPPDDDELDEPDAPATVQIAMPTLRGMSRGDATALLSSLGLVVTNVVEENSNRLENTVLRTEPAAGEDVTLFADAPVVLVVAGGAPAETPPPVPTLPTRTPRPTPTPTTRGTIVPYPVTAIPPFVGTAYPGPDDDDDDDDLELPPN